MHKQVDVNRMIKRATELIKRDPNLVAVFCGANKKIVRIVVMAGKDAVKKGINAGEIAEKTVSILGGGGGGRPDFTQGGGTLVDKISETMLKAEEIIRKQLDGS